MLSPPSVIKKNSNFAALSPHASRYYTMPLFDVNSNFAAGKYDKTGTLQVEKIMVFSLSLLPCGRPIGEPARKHRTK
jgi:hypothetical protein